jgi:hypothetical protein
MITFQDWNKHVVTSAHANADGQHVYLREAWRPFRCRQREAEPRPPMDQAGQWLRNAMLALALLAATAAVVSFAAQFRMVFTAKHSVIIAALQAGIPDASALIFASLSIALALHGKRAIRPRLLNVAAVATSVAMNWLAAGNGWRDVAIWVMPPIAYALASDTLIGVIRANALAVQRRLQTGLAEDDATPLAIVGGLLLWLLRLVLAPPSTITGFRTWVLDECPVAPGRTAAVQAPADRRALPPPNDQRRKRRPHTGKGAQFLQLVAERYGELAAIDLAKVSRIAAELAPQAGLHVGTARRNLRNAVLAAQSEVAA